MSDIQDNPTGARWRVVPLSNGKFQVEQWGEWDASVDWPYWGQFIKPHASKEEAEGYIQVEIHSAARRRLEYEESVRREAEFTVACPPYVFPPVPK